MSPERALELDSPMQAAVEELKEMIRRRYADAQFRVTRGDEYPAIVHLTTIVDLDDPDEVVGLVIDRMNQLLVDEGLPIFVIAIRTPERVVATREVASTSRPRAFQPHS